MKNMILVRRATMLDAAVAACYPLWAGATSAGRVDFATGNVVAVSPTGERRVVGKGSEIREGETLDTGAGRAQVRFSDGARVSLQPNTQFRIEEYRFAGKSDGTALVDRSRAQSTVIRGEMYVRGRVVSHRSLDYRSPVFAVAALSYSRTVTAIAATWLALWREANGDLTRRPPTRPVVPPQLAPGVQP